MEDWVNIKIGQYFHQKKQVNYRFLFFIIKALKEWQDSGLDMLNMLMQRNRN